MKSTSPGRTILALVTALSLTACATHTNSNHTNPQRVNPMPDNAHANTEKSVTSLANTQWLLAHVGGTKAPENVDFSLDEERFYTTDSCNRFIGAYQHSGENALKVDAVNSMSTRVGCDQKTETFKTAYLKALEQTRAFKSEGASMYLLDAKGNVLAEYIKQTKNIANTQWQVTAVNNGKQGLVSSAATQKLSVAFGANGAVNGFAGCNNFAGKYTTDQSNGKITISQLAITRKLCIDQETMQTEQWLVNALTQSSHFEQRGNVLELRHDGAMQVSLRKK